MEIVFILIGLVLGLIFGWLVANSKKNTKFQQEKDLIDQKYIGLDVHIKLLKPVSARRKFVGAIVSADENRLVLLIDNKQQDFLFSNIVKANLMV